jgi:hypothetical protein
MDAGRKNAEDGPVGPKRQIGIYLDREDWLRLRAHAARRGMPITSVFLERLRPLIDKLRRDVSAPDEA